MTTLTIRFLDDEVKQALRRQAAEHGRSMEAEARAILQEGVRQQDASGGLGSRIHQLFADVDGVDLELPSRTEEARAAELPE